jgi:hypothetical protein
MPYFKVQPTCLAWRLGDLNHLMASVGRVSIVNRNKVQNCDSNTRPNAVRRDNLTIALHNYLIQYTLEISLFCVEFF